MKQYIDKAVAVAELEKAIDDPAPSHDQQCPWEDGYYCGLYKAESIIDTLEVKEVEDLEKEIKDYSYDLPHSKTGIPGGWKFSWPEEEVIKIAKHFFELGLKTAQKGE